MVEVEYYFSSDSSWFYDLAASLKNATGVEIIVNDNKLEVPSSFGEGNFEFLELAEGLGVIRSDFVFHEDVKMIRKAVRTNEYFLVHFSLSLEQVIIHNANGEPVELGKHLSESVFYSSSGLGAEVIFPKNKRIRRVVVYASRAWILKQIKFFNIDDQGVVKNYVQNIPFQGTYNLDINSLNCAEYILNAQINNPIHLLYIKGEVLTLLSNFYKKANESIARKDRLLFTETEIVVQLVKELTSKMNVPWPTLGTIAKRCQMSKTKFAVLFQELFHTNYYSYYVQKRIEHACSLILDGTLVSEAGLSVCYTNLGHFSKVFKDHVGSSPSKMEGKCNEKCLSYFTCLRNKK